MIKKILLILGLEMCLLVVMPVIVLALPVLTSPDFQIDPDVSNTFGGSPSSTNYGLVDSGGEAVIGNGTSGSYKLTSGYVAQLQQSLQIVVSPSSLVLPPLTPGTSVNGSIAAVINTDAPGYDLAVSKNQLLTHSDTITTIPDVSSSIASPAAWVEGTTKGLGFTLTGAPDSITGKWGSNPNYNYAAIPTSTSTNFYTHTGYTGGNSQTINMQVRLDVSNNQKSGFYTSTATITATIKP
jgi:hypothetical protein